MSTIGNITLNLDTVDRDETVYARATHTVSHRDTVALRRTQPSKSNPALRMQASFQRGIKVIGQDGIEKNAIVTISTIVPVGVDVTAVTPFVSEALAQSATLMGTLAIKGDIHLE